MQSLTSFFNSSASLLLWKPSTSNFTEPLDPHILNIGVKFILKSGKHWLLPIQPRLATAFPSLTRTELDQYDQHCHSAVNTGYHLACKTEVHSISDDLLPDKITLSPAWRKFSANLHHRHDWIFSEHLEQIYIQGRRFARSH